MNNNHLITAATYNEIAGLVKQNHTSIHLNRLWESVSGMHILVTGIGQANTIHSLMKYLKEFGNPQSITNMGICGSFTDTLKHGDLVAVTQDTNANQIIEEEKKWFPWHEKGLGKVVPQMLQPQLPDWANRIAIPRVNGLTTDFLTDDIETIKKRKRFFNAEVESMEGAAVFYVAIEENIKAVQVRSVSNYVHERDKKLWSIDKAIEQLHIFTENQLKPIILS